MTPDAVREAAEALLGAIKAEQSWDDPNLDPDNFGCACHGGPVDDPLPMEARPCSSCRAKAVKVRALALEDALRRSALAAPSSPEPVTRWRDLGRTQPARRAGDAVAVDDGARGGVPAVQPDPSKRPTLAHSSPPDTFVDVVFDGPPSNESGRFVECEGPTGASVRAGEWIDRGNGMWALRIPLAPSSPPVSGAPGTVSGPRVDEDGCCRWCGRSIQPSPCCIDYPSSPPVEAQGEPKSAADVLAWLREASDPTTGEPTQEQAEAIWALMRHPATTRLMLAVQAWERGQSYAALRGSSQPVEAVAWVGMGEVASALRDIARRITLASSPEWVRGEVENIANRLRFQANPPSPAPAPVEAVAVDHIAAARLVGLGAIVEAERVCGQTRLLTAEERVAAADRAVRIVYAAVPPSPSPAPSGVEVAAVREAGLAAYDALPMNEKATITAQHPRYCYAKGWLAHAQESAAAGKGE